MNPPQNNQQVHLVSRPDPEPSLNNFALVSSVIPPVMPGQVLVRNKFLSLDPYMRLRMSDSKSYASPQPLHTVMHGSTVGLVVCSRNDRFKEGDVVLGWGGWQEYSIGGTGDQDGLQIIDAERLPASVYLSAAGMTGVTAWYGITKVIDPQAGETVVVSAASGAVGGIAGQLAKLRGCRVVGVAGGAQKCRFVVEQLGFDACVDYKAHPDANELAQALRASAPEGIDGIFENVGGDVLNAAIANANPHSRVALCGMISANTRDVPLTAPRLLLTNRMSVKGFVIPEHPDVWPEAMNHLASLLVSHKLKYRESIAHGLGNAPAAFLGMLKGENFGKQLVQLH
jgi:NADPH-dependent curcumin reductase